MRILRSLLLTALVWLPATAQATVFSYTVTGFVNGMIVPEGVLLFDDDPFTGSETFTLTFDFDDSIGSDFSSPTVANYPGAVSNVALTIAGGPASFLDAASADVLMAYNTGNHQWSFFSSWDDTDLPETLEGEDDVGDPVEFELNGLNLFVLDTSESLLSQAPPELTAFDPEGTNAYIFEVEWIGLAFEESVIADLQVTDVSRVPEPATLALGLLGLASFGAFRRR